MTSQAELKSGKCKPCEGGVEKLSSDAVARYLTMVEGWESRDDKIHKTYRFKDFRQAMGFLNRMAEIAEEQGHHPDFSVHYNVVSVTIWTHAIGGLSENDFILAAQIDQVA